MNKLIGGLVVLIGILGVFYIGGFILFVQPILAACKSFDAGTLTMLAVGVTVLKCIFAGTVGVLIAWLGMVVGAVIAKD